MTPAELLRSRATRARRPARRLSLHKPIPASPKPSNASRNLDADWHAVEPEEGYDAKAAEWHRKLDDHKAANATPSGTEKPESGK